MDAEKLKYTREHLWVDIQGRRVRFGITDHAQRELEDIVHVELPEKGKEVARGEIVCTIESVKSTSDLSTPLSGTVSRVNDRLRDAPEAINQDPYGEGWLFELEASHPEQGEELLDHSAYQESIRE